MSETPETILWHRDRLQILWTEERVKRRAAEKEAGRLFALLDGMLVPADDPDAPLYRRISNQRRELKQANFWRDYYEKECRELRAQARSNAVPKEDQ